MLVQEAIMVFWQSLRDAWEELFPLVGANILWLLLWALPLAGGIAVSIPLLQGFLIVLALALFSIGTAGIYHITNRIAHGKASHFSDFIDGIRLWWWRAILWMLANLLFLWLVWLNLWFYSNRLQGLAGILVGGFWLALAFFWLAMQGYFWPMLLQLEQPRMLLAWRNAALLILANPFYSFLFIFFTVLTILISITIAAIFVFVGMALVGLLGNNAVLTLLFKLGIIENPRPEPPAQP